MYSILVEWWLKLTAWDHGLCVSRLLRPVSLCSGGGKAVWTRRSHVDIIIQKIFYASQRKFDCRFVICGSNLVHHGAVNTVSIIACALQSDIQLVQASIAWPARRHSLRSRGYVLRWQERNQDCWMLLLNMGRSREITCTLDLISNNIMNKTNFDLVEKH